MIQKFKPLYKIKRTEEQLTSRTGLVVFGDFLKAIDFEKILKSFPKPLNDQGYGHMAYIIPIMLMMYAGGRSVADIREIREDKALRELLGLNIIPSESALGIVRQLFCPVDDNYFGRF